MDALHYFKTNKQGTLKLINDTCRGLLRMQSDDELEAFYDESAKIFEESPTPDRRRFRMSFSWGYTTPRKTQVSIRW